MRTLDPESSEKGLAPFQLDGEEMATALTHGLDLPLAALRASMETLFEELEERDSGRRVVLGALDEVDRLSRNVRELMEYATPPNPMPLLCSVEEIAISARRGLRKDDRSRVIMAHTTGTHKLNVDGPLLSRCLRRLIENSLEASTEDVLLAIRQDRSETSFTIVDSAPGMFDTEWAVSAFNSTKRNRLGLGLALVRRDAALLGGELLLLRSARGETSARLHLPHAALELAA